MKDNKPSVATTPVLPWMRLPISIPTGSGVALQEVHGLLPPLKAAVSDVLGFDELFPVQTAVWRGLAGGHSTAHDMCICAPTGSGKTLAYALPLLNAIASRRHPHISILTGLVVLPTRGLAVQVHSVLSALGNAVGLSVALVAAQESVAAEAAKLIASPSRPGSGPHIVVATPGRLMAHLHSTSGFDLHSLKFLVVDEADRLLRQDYQGWLPEVLQQLQHQGSSSSALPPWAAGQQYSHHQQAVSSESSYPGASSFPDLPYGSGNDRCLKLLVSATLTRDPSKLLRLALHNPRFITLTDVQQRYTLPKTLMQYRAVVPAQHKPLALLGLLQTLSGTSTIVFASSLETTHRLYLMLAAVPDLPYQVAEYSSHVAPAQRTTTLAAFKSGAVKVLVTSDAMARGMDVATVANVINYDPPVYPKAYIHRAGRTARAGQAGAVYTLLKPEDVVHFNNMVKKMHPASVQQVKLTPAQLQPLRPALKQALQEVQQLLEQERREQQSLPDRHTKQQQQQGQKHKKRMPDDILNPILSASNVHDTGRAPEVPTGKKARPSMV